MDTLPTFEDRAGFLHVFCPWCCCFHHHSMGLGHRAAHCVLSDSPYLMTGYDMRPAGEYTPDMGRVAPRLQRIALAREKRRLRAAAAQRRKAERAEWARKG